MVVDCSRELSDDEVDRLFHALADATRRDLLVRTADGEQSVSALARCYPLSTTAIQKHVAVLVDAGLLRTRRRGRELIVTTDPERFATAHHVLDRLEALWRERLGRFGDVLAELDQGG